MRGGAVEQVNTSVSSQKLAIQGKHRDRAEIMVRGGAQTRTQDPGLKVVGV